MADSIRQQIMDLVKARFQTIQITNGYETNIGRRAFLWRDTRNVPATETESREMSLSIRDYREEHQPQVSGRADHHHTLYVECDIAAGVTAAGGLIDGDKQIRKAISDIIKAIGASTNGQPGYNWANSGGTKLAFLTLPIENEIGVEQMGRTTATAFYRFKIEYRTQRWNPYEQ